MYLSRPYPHVWSIQKLQTTFHTLECGRPQPLSNSGRLLFNGGDMVCPCALGDFYKMLHRYFDSQFPPEAPPPMWSPSRRMCMVRQINKIRSLVIINPTSTPAQVRRNRSIANSYFNDKETSSREQTKPYTPQGEL